MALATTGMMLMALCCAASSQAAATFVCGTTGTITLNSTPSTTIAVTGGNVVTIDAGPAEPACAGMQSLLIDGDAAATTVNYSGAVAGTVTADLKDNADIFQASGSQPVIVLGGAGADTLTGASGGDFLFGQGDADTLSGGPDNDVLLPGTGGGSATGGANSGVGDTVSYVDVPAVASPAVTVTADLDPGSATVLADAQTMSGIENLSGSEGDDVLIGDNNKNALDGAGGNDVLRPGEGLGSNDGGTSGLAGDTVSFEDVTAVAAPALTVTADLTGATVPGGTQTLVNVENLTGSAGNDALRGDDGKNDLNGLAGDDVLRPGTGTGTSTGGPSTPLGDSVVWDTVPAAPPPAVTVTANAVTGNVTLPSHAQTISAIENLVGSNGDDVLIGDNGPNDLSGLDGNDVLRPGEGTGTNNGGPSTLAGGDTVSWQDVPADAPPLVTVTADVAANATVSGDMQGLSSVENLTGSPGDDVLVGDGAKNDLDGLAGDDVLRPGVGAGTSTGGSNTTVGDTVSFETVAAVAPPAITVTADLSGVAGSTSVPGATQTLADVENLTGSPGNDVLIGDGGKNVLEGRAGDDVLRPGGGLGTNDGGASTLPVGDTVSFQDVPALSSPAVTVTANVATNAAVPGATQGLTSIENLTGSPGDDVLIGDINRNQLNGLAGDDLLRPGAGPGNNIGGASTAAGGDTVSFEDVPALAAPAVTVSADVSAGATLPADTQGLSSVENLKGSPGDDVLIGDGAKNDLDGLGGDDLLRPGAGAGTTTGGTNTPVGDQVSFADVTALAAPAVTVAVNLDTTVATVSGDSQNVVGVENASGTSGGDHLTGEGGPNVLRGLAGDDVLSGLGGDDLLVPGTGGGSNNGGGGTDTVSYADIAPVASPAVTMTVNLAAGTATGPGVLQLVVDLDIVLGGPGDDVLTGDTQNNELNGAGGNDTVSYEDRGSGEPVSASLITLSGGQIATAENDTYPGVENLRGGAGDDQLTGNGDKNVLAGGPGADTLDGQGDDDVLMPGTGAGFANGGTGVNTVSYADVPPATPPAVTVRVNLDSASAVVLGVTQGLAAIQKVLGSPGNDVLIGDALNNALDGADGEDTASYEDRVVGENIVATLAGGSGGQALTPENDTYFNVENLTGGDGNDTLTGNGAPNTLSGRGGTDTLNGLGDNDRLRPGTGTGTSTGGAGNNTVSFDDVPPVPPPGTTISVNLVSGTATVVFDGQVLNTIQNVVGSAGNDVITGSTADNVLDGGDGTDLVWYVDRTAAHPVEASLATGVGGELPEIDNYLNIENLRGGLGNDKLTGNTMSNVLHGDLGSDTVTYSDRVVGQNVVASLASGSGGQTGTGENDSYLSVENLTGGGGNDRLTGNTANNVLDGAGGVNTVSYGDRVAGQDIVASLVSNSGGQTGSAENDQFLSIRNLAGGGGNDTLTGNDDANELDGAGGTDTVSYADRVAGEHVIASLATGFGGQPSIGEADSYLSVENLTGGAGNDTFEGNGLGNVLAGGLGDDTLGGGAEADVLSGELGTDTATYATNSAAQPVNVSLDGVANDGIGGVAEGDNVVGTENVTGGDGSDVLRGNQDVNVLRGAAGNDVIDGAGSSDALDGGAGTDTVSYAARGPGDGVTATLEGAGGGTGELDSITQFERLLGGAGNDSLAGSAGDDEIRGGPGSDVVTGAAGNDTLAGEDGPDALSGGPGSDGLTGGDGNDQLTGGTEIDGFDAGPGDDDVSAFDGNAEAVVCGDGLDRADHDISDVFSAGDCEARTLLGFVPPPFALDPRVRDRDRDGSFAGFDCNDFDPTIRPGGPDIPGDGIDQNCNGSDAAFPPISTDFRLRFEKARTGTRIKSFELRRLPANAKIFVRCTSKKAPRCVFKSRTTTLKGQRARYSIRGHFGDRPLSNGSTIEVRVSSGTALGRTIKIAIRKPGQTPKITRGCLAIDAVTPAPCP